VALNTIRQVFIYIHTHNHTQNANTCPMPYISNINTHDNSDLILYGTAPPRVCVFVVHAHRYIHTSCRGIVSEEEQLSKREIEREREATREE